jgi:hypothetical protein
MKITKPAKEERSNEDIQNEIVGIADKDIGQNINQEPEAVKADNLPAVETMEYVTKGGETLSEISGKANINNNPLKGHSFTGIILRPSPQ